MTRLPLLAIAAFVLGVHGASAGPLSWQIFQTSLDGVAMAPLLVGSLVLDPTAAGRGTVNFGASSENPSGGAGGPFAIAGDTDFDFNLQGRDIPDLGNIFQASVGLTVAGTLVDGFISMFGEGDDIDAFRIVDNLVTGRIASDGTFLGCTYNQCAFTAFLADPPSGTVPEPSSLLILAPLLAVGAAVALRQRGQIGKILPIWLLADRRGA